MPRQLPNTHQFRERLWSGRRGQAWSCELVDHAKWGFEARILRKGQLLIGRRFETRQGAVEWAARERRCLLGLAEHPSYFLWGLRTAAVIAAAVLALVVVAPRVMFAA